MSHALRMGVSEQLMRTPRTEVSTASGAARVVGGASDSAQEVPWAKHRVCCSVTSATYLQNTQSINQSQGSGGAPTQQARMCGTPVRLHKCTPEDTTDKTTGQSRRRTPSLVGAAPGEATRDTEEIKQGVIEGHAARTVPGPRSWSNTPRGSRAAGRAPAGSACPDAAHWRCGHSASTAPGAAQ
jgi:hypothetical protein